MLNVSVLAYQMGVCVINQRKIEEYLKYLVQRGIIHEGQLKDVLNRSQEQALSILLQVFRMDLLSMPNST